MLDDIVAVSDEEISEAIVLLLERTKLVVEGAGAVGVAALLAGKVGGSGCVVPVLSGGNIDATLLISVMRHGLAVAGRYLVVRTRVPDRPGELAKLLALLARGARQRRRGRAPARDGGSSRRRDRRRADARHARLRALRRDPAAYDAARACGYRRPNASVARLVAC